MPDVFVCHHDKLRKDPLDLSKAESYGNIRTVFTREVFPDNADMVMPESIERAHEILKDFDPDEDYLALVGSPMLIAVCSAILGSYYSKFQVLRYDRRYDGYYPVIIDLDDEDEPLSADTTREESKCPTIGSQPTSGNCATGVCALPKR